MSKIKTIKAREILDSKGSPTIEVSLTTDLGVFSASIPSGVSTGEDEALELRDDDGKGVSKAIKNIEEILAPALKGKDPIKQKTLDDLMIALDGTKNKSCLGANAILPVSIAISRAGAASQKLPLWRHLSQAIESRPRSAEDGTRSLPRPCVLIFEGGKHAQNNLSPQEFMVVASEKTFKENFKIVSDIYNKAGELVEEKYGRKARKIGLEGGFDIMAKNTEETLDLLEESIKSIGARGIKIIIDVAASHFFENGKYFFEGKEFKKDDLLNFYSGLAKKYPLLGLEDSFDQNDWQSWKELSAKLKVKSEKSLVIGDDLIATNKKRLERAIKEKAASGIIIKPNQIGTVTETMEVAKMAQKAGFELFVKHRGGETNDDFIADLAVGLGAGYIMAGAPSKPERMAKYNRMLEIEKERGDK